MEKTPKVNEVNEFLEIASDFEDPLEAIREALSNSYDAEASEVRIEIRTRENGSDIIIEDDGEGMDAADLESFFDLGNSNKDGSIGYKGHGTKIFYKSDEIVVNTSKDGLTHRAKMERPWDKLNERVLPTYSVSTTETTKSRQGTFIRISGFKSEAAFDPESLTYNKIHHYLKWDTIAGSTAHYFDEDPHEFRVEVKLDPAIDDSMDWLVTTNRLEFPSEQLDPGEGNFPEERMCKRYPPEEIEVSHDEGTSKIQVVGMAGGKAARNELATYGKHSAQFGVWLAKDHIKIEQANQVISSDNEFLHFFFIANCQDLELSANRGKIRNKASPVYSAIIEELDHYMSKVANDPWFKRYLEIRRLAAIERKTSDQRESIDERITSAELAGGLEPTNREELLVAWERYQQRNGEDRKIVDIDLDSEIELLFDSDGRFLPGSLHYHLTDFFEQDRSPNEIEFILCWELGDLDYLTDLERNGYQNNDIEFDFEKKRVLYGPDGSEMEVIQLSQLD